MLQFLVEFMGKAVGPEKCVFVYVDTSSSSSTNADPRQMGSGWWSSEMVISSSGEVSLTPFTPSRQWTQADTRALLDFLDAAKRDIGISEGLMSSNIYFLKRVMDKRQMQPGAILLRPGKSTKDDARSDSTRVYNFQFHNGEKWVDTITP